MTGYMLPVKRLGGVAPEMTLINNSQTRKCASEGCTVALKSRPDLNRSSKQGYQWMCGMCPPKIKI